MMNVFDAITTRRSVGRVTQETVPREIIERILESAIHAPNHKITEPWRFHVFTGKGRGELAKARAEVARIIAGEEKEDEELIKGRISRERKKAFRAPVVVAVISKAGRDEVETIENYAACSAAVQNMQLAAHSLGLGAMWRTGPVAYHEHMREFFALDDEGDKIVAYLYVGYPDLSETKRRREPVENMTTWREG
ncbi:MAG: nitroreductase [Rubrobacter sp.]|nr:nitroreductase [Rubrobacter sp.]